MQEIVQQKLADAVSFKLPPLTPREARVPAIPGKAHAVIGMRRAGKTWFLYQCMQERLSRGRPRESLVYFNLEDDRLAGIRSGQLAWILEDYYRRFPDYRDAEPVTLLLDEIQVVPGWEAFVRRILDTENVEVFVSGSSARLLSREVATSLRGRSTETVIFPYSFREFLIHHGQAVPADPDFVPKRQVSLLEGAFAQYLEVGGFPEAQGLEERDRIGLLQGYVDSVILRDVVERHSITNVEALRRLVRQLLGAAGGRFSVHRFYNDLRSQGLPVSKQTLHELMAYLEDAFLFVTASLATTSERRRQSNPRKIYPLDPGMVRAFDRSGKRNVGSRLETAVALELARRSSEWGYCTTASGQEVDFQARLHDGTELLIQVCAGMSEEGTREREAGALEEALRDFPEACGLLLTLTNEDARLARVERAETIPVWRWLLRS
ncbi:MAG: hypothetical protein AMXMBFR33_25630 [Candidatus Xenobia bacterium]